jgi:hypothetical protein
MSNFTHKHHFHISPNIRITAREYNYLSHNRSRIQGSRYEIQKPHNLSVSYEWLPVGLLGLVFTECNKNVTDK